MLLLPGAWDNAAAIADAIAGNDFEDAFAVNQVVNLIDDDGGFRQAVSQNCAELKRVQPAGTERWGSDLRGSRPSGLGVEGIRQVDKRLGGILFRFGQEASRDVGCNDTGYSRVSKKGDRASGSGEPEAARLSEKIGGLLGEIGQALGGGQAAASLPSSGKSFGHESRAGFVRDSVRGLKAVP